LWRRLPVDFKAAELSDATEVKFERELIDGDARVVAPDRVGVTVKHIGRGKLGAGLRGCRCDRPERLVALWRQFAEGEFIQPDAALAAGVARDGELDLGNFGEGRAGGRGPMRNSMARSC